MEQLAGKIALVTGASSGIGAACARALAKEGLRVIVAARRTERIEALRDELVASYGPDACGALTVDLRDREDVVASMGQIASAGWGEIELLVNNAGLAAGLAPVHEGSFDHWDRMIETNITGLLNISRLVLPGMVERGSGQVVNIGSVSGREVYPNGAVYCGTKFFVRALNKGLRLDLHGTGIRVTAIDPGMVETEFSEVRFDGDKEKAAKVYEGTRALRAEDVADTVVWVVSRPPHINVEEILLMPTDQASVWMTHRC